MLYHLKYLSQCVAACCSVLQIYNIVHDDSIRSQVPLAVCCSVLQCVAVCCSVLQIYNIEHDDSI